MKPNEKNTMITRRDILKAALLLPAAPTLLARKAEAQSTIMPPAVSPNSDTEIIADFETGTYIGWTLEGDCFGDAPASDALFPGKITGFEGTYFACSLHPRKGTNATGKAISREFTITKPFINFKIGGGNHPNEACLNLMIDGKVVRTATGSDTPELVNASWDVYDQIGKKAHFEILDVTKGADRGYIAVDEIKLNRKPNTDFQAKVETVVNHYLEQYHGMGIVVQATIQGEMVASYAIGKRDIARAEPITEFDQVSIGSMSKPVTAYIIGCLVQEGKLSWNSTFRDVCPDFSKNIQSPLCDATLAQFITHTSGLGHVIIRRYQIPNSLGSPQKWRQEGTKWLFTGTPVSDPPTGKPGEKYFYAGGILPASVMAEQATGLTLEQLFKKYIGDALGFYSIKLGLGEFDEKSVTKPRGHFIDPSTGKFERYGEYDVWNLALGFRSDPAGFVTGTPADLIRLLSHITGMDNKAGHEDLYKTARNNPFEISPFTLAGWQKWSAGLFHAGSIGHGEYANCQVLDKPCATIFLYCNFNWWPESNFTAGELVGALNNVFLTT